MTAYRTPRYVDRARSAVPEMPTRRTLALTGLVDGWWPGVSRQCHVCGGRLWLTPPDVFGRGDVSCLNCGREYAEVIRYARPLSPAGPLICDGCGQSSPNRLRLDLCLRCYGKRWRRLQKAKAASCTT